MNGIEDVLPDNLESLELGECTNLPDTIATEALVKLTSLKRLRLEKGQGNCPTAKFLQAVANLPNLVQLELINFDIKPGFDVAIGQCTNLKTLLIIPTYVTQVNNVYILFIVFYNIAVSNYLITHDFFFVKVVFSFAFQPLM